MGYIWIIDGLYMGYIYIYVWVIYGFYNLVGFIKC